MHAGAAKHAAPQIHIVRCCTPGTGCRARENELLDAAAAQHLDVSITESTELTFDFSAEAPSRSGVFCALCDTSNSDSVASATLVANWLQCVLPKADTRVCFPSAAAIRLGRDRLHCAGVLRRAGIATPKMVALLKSDTEHIEQAVGHFKEGARLCLHAAERDSGFRRVERLVGAEGVGEAIASRCKGGERPGTLLLTAAPPRFCGVRLRLIYARSRLLFAVCMDAAAGARGGSKPEVFGGKAAKTVSAISAVLREHGVLIAFVDVAVDSERKECHVLDVCTSTVPPPKMAPAASEFAAALCELLKEEGDASDSVGAAVSMLRDLGFRTPRDDD